MGPNLTTETIELLTIEDLQKILKLGKTTTYKLCNCKSFPATKIGGQFRITRQALINWIDSNAGRNINI